MMEDAMKKITGEIDDDISQYAQQLKDWLQSLQFEVEGVKAMRNGRLRDIECQQKIADLEAKRIEFGEEQITKYKQLLSEINDI